MVEGDPVWNGTECVGFDTGVVERSYPVDRHTTYEWAIAYEYAEFSGQTPWWASEANVRATLALYHDDELCKSARLLRRTLIVEEVAV